MAIEIFYNFLSLGVQDDTYRNWNSFNCMVFGLNVEFSSFLDVCILTLCVMNFSVLAVVYVTSLYGGVTNAQNGNCTRIEGTSRGGHKGPGTRR